MVEPVVIIPGYRLAWMSKREILETLKNAGAPIDLNAPGPFGVLPGWEIITEDMRDGIRYAWRETPRPIPSPGPEELEEIRKLCTQNFPLRIPGDSTEMGHNAESVPQKGQTRRGSLLESLANIAVGYSINYVANMLIFPLFGWNLSTRENLTLGVIYTAISLARSYTLRRIFNRGAIRK